MTFVCMFVTYGVASVSKVDKMTGLFCKRALENRLYSAQKTYNFKEPTNRSHPISVYVYAYVYVCTHIHSGAASCLSTRSTHTLPFDLVTQVCVTCVICMNAKQCDWSRSVCRKVEYVCEWYPFDL